MSPIVVICSEFNKNLVEELYSSAVTEYESYIKRDFQKAKASRPLNRKDLVGCNKDFQKIKASRPLKQIWVPGAGEIPQAVQWVLSPGFNQDFSKEKSSIVGVLALGVIIRGKTAHFDFLQNLLQTALWDLQKKHAVPLVFSVLMLEKRDQFKERVIRAKESMQALLKMIQLRDNFKGQL